ncbi:uncharacterized protein LOC111828646 [Capsella rubella]|uniref:uncharacterized protein LOC111828646 n=1 Tax=Capsella rubella TaxID=81985 RepID=UPI000CD5C0C5|nr:uncharacterized protein LOC111828646 [Capsella rubella]
MYKVVCLLALSFLLLFGLPNTAEARVLLPYESPNPREGVWDQKMIKEIKAEVDRSCSSRAGGRGPPNRPESHIPGSPKRCNP